MILSIFYTLMSIGLIEKPSFLAKVGWMVLTSLSELKSANKDFFLKAIGYWIHGICVRLDLGFSPFLLAPEAISRFPLSSSFSIVSF